MELKVSIATVTYNHEAYLKKTLDSFLAQKTNFQYEIVIGEDCSTDRTRDVFYKYQNKYPEKIHVITSEKNVGSQKNALRTINACIGKYIAMCEGDDYWTDPYKLQKQVDFLEENSEYGLISSDINLIDTDGNLLPDNNMVLKQRANRKPKVDFFDLLGTNLINTLTVCTRADLMKELAERVLNENLCFVYDYWFWLNISLKSKIRISYEKTASYRVHEGDISHNNKKLSLQSCYIQKDAIERNAIEAKFGQAKNGYNLNHIRAKLKETSES